MVAHETLPTPSSLSNETEKTSKQRKQEQKECKEQESFEWKDGEFPSIVEIKKILPKHCFQPSLSRSLSYVAKDITLVSILFASIYFANNLTVENVFWKSTIMFFLFPLYWFLQGTLFWAIFVLGHDCGHGSFSENESFNSFLGTILHTFILVPYQMWRFSHRHHHKNTGNFQKDEIFYPVEEPAKAPLLATDKVPAPVFLSLGWFAYLVYGYPPRAVSHFNVNHPLFAERFTQVVTSLSAWIFWVSFLTYCCLTGVFTVVQLVVYYLIPIVIFACWLTLVTFLHHHEPGVVWYNSEKWNFVKGNLSSVDRDYGIFHTLTHNIGTHQIHHLFPKIPHYHLEEATAAFRKAFPHLIRKSDQTIIEAFSDNHQRFSSQKSLPQGTEYFVVPK